MMHVNPAEVNAFKARLAPAFEELLERGPRSSEADALLDAWGRYDRAPVDWLDAPRELEFGRDLEARLAWLQGPGTRAPSRATTAPGVTVGEVLGMHTVAELRDFLAAKQKEHDETNKAADLAAADWKAKDPDAAAKFVEDLAAANEKWDSASSAAQLTLQIIPDAIQSVTPLPDFPAGMGQSVWQAVAEAAHPWADLQARLAAVGHAPAPYSVPQPTAVDPDLEVYKGADVAARTIESAAKTSVSIAVPVLALGAVALVALALRK